MRNILTKMICLNIMILLSSGTFSQSLDHQKMTEMLEYFKEAKKETEKLSEYRCPAELLCYMIVENIDPIATYINLMAESDETCSDSSNLTADPNLLKNIVSYLQKMRDSAEDKDQSSYVFLMEQMKKALVDNSGSRGLILDIIQTLDDPSTLHILVHYIKVNWTGAYGTSLRTIDLTEKICLTRPENKSCKQAVAQLEQWYAEEDIENFKGGADEFPIMKIKESLKKCINNIPR